MGGDTSVSAGEVWKTFNTGTKNISLEESKSYIFAVWSKDNNFTVWFDTSQADYTRAIRSLTYGDFPDPAEWSNRSADSNTRFSIYATYTPAAEEGIIGPFPTFFRI